MTYRINTLLDTTLVHSPLQPIFEWRIARHLTILTYHDISDPECFAQQLDYLVNEMHPISLEEALNALKTLRSLPQRAVLLTFDDGQRSVFEHALPLLRKRGIPGIVFVVAGLVDTDQPFWWAEVKALVRNGGIATGFANSAPETVVRVLKKVSEEQRQAAVTELRRTAHTPAPPMPQLRSEELVTLEAAGIAVGNHTFSHPCLNRCSVEKVQAEITQAHALLTQILGHAPCVFAYPNGDTDPEAVRMLHNLDYAAAFLFDHRHSPHQPVDHLRISRLRVDSHTPLDRFRLIVSGLHPALHHMLGRA